MSCNCRMHRPVEAQYYVLSDELVDIYIASLGRIVSSKR